MKQLKLGMTPAVNYLLLLCGKCFLQDLHNNAQGFSRKLDITMISRCCGMIGLVGAMFLAQKLIPHPPDV